MIVDSSVIVAIVNDEPMSDRYLETIARDASRHMSAATFLESAIVIDRHTNPLLNAVFDRLMDQLRLDIVPVTFQQARIAREAYQRYGKGSGHPARLNLGDCFAYALAKALDEPLLFIGNDFVHTDVRPALRSLAS